MFKFEIDDADLLYSPRRRCRWIKEQQLWVKHEELNQGDGIGQLRKSLDLGL
jgi:hypothetical protein